MGTLNIELCTAIVTPFNADSSVDFAGLERLTQHLIDTGSDAILVNGSTGENPTLTTDEKLAVLKTVKKIIGNRPVKLIAGSATNDTQSTIELSRLTEKAGVDALLIVVPYYNKPSQRGLVAHFGAVASAIDGPMIIYNIPGRSIVNMTAETMSILATSHSNIIGVKQSNPDMDQVSDIRGKTPASFRIWCGDDSLTIPMMSLGAYGTFSVASHVTGNQIRSMIAAFKQGNLDVALQHHLALMPVFKELFFLPNPTVVKACLAQLGLIQPYLRLPLVLPDETEMKRIEALVQVIRSLTTADTTGASPKTRREVPA